jgi:hypothetical protein
MTQLPSRRPVKIRPRVDFDMEEYRKMVFAKGVDLTWEQCAECPCSQPSSNWDVGLIETTTTTTGEARVDCTLCDGKGYYWHSEQEIRAIVTGGSSKTDLFSMYGEYARGMVSVSLLPEHLPAYGDRFTVLNSVMVFRETKVRTENTIEALRYPVQARTLDLSGGETSLSVTRLQRAGLDGLSTEADVLVEGVDFTVTSEGKIDFTLGDSLGTAPVESARYSITYYARPRYYVAERPHTHRDSVTKRKAPTESALMLPIQAHCSLEFMGYDHG